MRQQAQLLAIGAVMFVASAMSPALAQYPPQIDTVPRDNHGSSPAGTNSVCTLGPNTGAPSPTCPVLKINGYSFWAFNYNDNRIAMAILAYDPAGNLVKTWEKGGARYLWQINVNGDSRTVDFMGQSNAKVTMTWEELAAETQPGALAVVKVSAGALNCLFTNPCAAVTSTDTAANISLPPNASGVGQLLTRTFVGAAGSAAAGQTAYGYRVDMTQAVSLGDASCVTDVTVDFGPDLQLNYDGSGPSDGFTIAQGDSGTIGILYAVRFGNSANFVFEQPVCAGATAGSGQSSLYFGMTAAAAPKAVTMTLGWPGLTGIAVAARGPAY